MLDPEKERQKTPEIKPEVKDAPKTPQQEIADTEAKIKAFNLKQELESRELGYKNLAHRENTIADREKALQDKIEKLEKDIGAFELEQKNRVENVNNKADEYNEQFNLLKTEREQTQKLMTDAIAQKAKADGIIKSQTETEKINQEKQEAYDDNMDEAIGLLAEIVKVLRQQVDDKALSLAITLSKDYNLIKWLQYKKCDLQTIADIISVECDRIVEVCEYLQNSKRDYSSVLKYLLDCTAWFEEKLKIEWKPEVIELPS